jgi:hypothetical protein
VCCEPWTGSGEVGRKEEQKSLQHIAYLPLWRGTIASMYVQKSTLPNYFCFVVTCITGNRDIAFTIQTSCMHVQLDGSCTGCAFLRSCMAAGYVIYKDAHAKMTLILCDVACMCCEACFFCGGICLFHFEASLQQACLATACRLAKPIPSAHFVVLLITH